MKKFIAITSLIGVLVLGSACGSSHNWSDKDKADLAVGIAAGEALGIWTETQGDCLSHFLQDRFDGLDAADKLTEAEQAKNTADLKKECGIDFDALAEAWNS